MHVTYTKYFASLTKFTQLLDTNKEKFKNDAERKLIEHDIQFLKELLLLWNSLCQAKSLVELETRAAELTKLYDAGSIKFTQIKSDNNSELWTRLAREYICILESSADLQPSPQFYANLSLVDKAYLKINWATAPKIFDHQHISNEIKALKQAVSIKQQVKAKPLAAPVVPRPKPSISVVPRPAPRPALVYTNPIPTDATQDLEVAQVRVDNPGGGDCAFYAFATGLINIIQVQSASEDAEKHSIFNLWCALDPKIADHWKEIREYDYKQIIPNPFLKILQASLRRILYNNQLSELKNDCALIKRDLDAAAKDKDADPYKTILANTTFRRFTQVYHGQETDSRYNPLATAEIKEKIRSLKKNQTKKSNSDRSLDLGIDQMLSMFIQLFYGEKVKPEDVTESTAPLVNSLVSKGLQSINQMGFWGTHDDLNILAQYFKINFNYHLDYRQPYRFSNLPDRHTLVANNEGNAHWTTFITTLAKKQPSFSNVATLGTPTSSTAKPATPAATKADASNTAKPATPAATKTDASNTAKPATPAATKTDTSSTAKPGTPAVTKTEASSTAKPVTPAVTKTDTSSTAKLATPAATKTDASSTTKPVTQTRNINRKSEEELLSELKEQVKAATDAYIDHTNKIKISIFHRHGEAGKIRASLINTCMSQQSSLQDARKFICDALSDKKSGNTYPHSYRTMLLESLLSNTKIEENNLAYKSNGFNIYLAILKSTYKVDVTTPTKKP